ncbi:hypothetical protein ACIBEF_17315 [Micromonospora sp. NPDC050795]|uniref:hypothetical protein n=1 Tax=Micromonospora sp. NPDC050795 TaxID=3364282 RepID=UPI00379B7125
MNPFRRADHADTERLLDAASARPDATPDQGASAAADATSPEAHLGTRDVPPAEPVAALLAAAAGPVRPGELAGEDAAVAAFRAARANPAAVPQRPRRRRMTTGAVAWIGAVAATATAGAAFAAVTRELGPDPVAPAPSRPSPSPHQSASRSAEPDRSVGPGVASPTGASPSVTALPSAGPTPAGQVHGLCRAWRAKKPEQREKALRTPGFHKLVTAAGGPAEVEAYCQRLVPETKPSEPAEVTPSESPKGKPSPSGKAPPSPPGPGHRAHG